jgi:heme/copper-type cytochrome/quinol oxidase subunit 2
MGIKMDAIPGRINQVNMKFDKLGMFRGQCSEFCGIGHGFMPIVVQSCNILDY